MMASSLTGFLRERLAIANTSTLFGISNTYATPSASRISNLRLSARLRLRTSSRAAIAIPRERLFFFLERYSDESNSLDLAELEKDALVFVETIPWSWWNL